MKIAVITSCTGEKRSKPESQLTIEDFRHGPKHFEKREAELAEFICAAEDLYTGMQHARLMRGVRAARKSKAIDLALWIVSAGYGVVRGSRKLAPYECTFSGMKTGEIEEWAEFLDIPRDIKTLLAKQYDLVLVLLGDAYLRACQLSTKVEFGAPTLFLTGKASAKGLPADPLIKSHVLTNSDTRKFACGLVGLKGEVGARVLEGLASGKFATKTVFGDPKKILSSLADSGVEKAKKPKARPNPLVDHVIQIPKSWWDKPHREKLRYFIPEWDDLVDPDYDFEADEHSGGTGDWSNEVYAHQMFPEPNYDGILMSRAVSEKNKKKNKRLNELGVHRYVRMPREFPVMGDCGAFDYIEQKEPPFTTDDVIDYYTRLDFDLGVSVDHLIVPAFAEDQLFRYQLTIQNAEDFLGEHRKLALPWEPIGAVQGWDPRSYADAVDSYQKMGYESIALGGLVRSSTKNIAAVLQEVKPRLRAETRVHLFGIARPEALRLFSNLGVTSVDSASHLRRAWLVAKDNYFTLDGDSFSAIRIPDVNKSFRAKRIVKEGRATQQEVGRLERNCIRAVHDFDHGRIGVEKTLDILEEYDQLISEGRGGMRQEFRRTLESTPWRHCRCAICREVGIEVMIFRGNNRNRRRGFHNTYVFYRLMQDSLLGERHAGEATQLHLFNAVANE